MAIGPLPPLDVLGTVVSKTDHEAVLKGTTADNEGVTLTIDGPSASKYFTQDERFRVHFVPLPEPPAL